LNPHRLLRADAVSGRRGQQKTGIAVAKPVTGCKRPFSKLFNVAASRPAKSPRNLIALLELTRLAVNADWWAGLLAPLPPLDIDGHGLYFRCGFQAEAFSTDFVT
jgi:hypothetical protein